MEDEVIQKEIPVDVEETVVVAPLDRMRSMERFKDREYETESMALEDALSALDELEATSKEGSDFKDAMFELLTNVPELGYLFDDYKKTGNFMVSLQSLFENPEDMLLRDGDDGYDMAQQRRSDFLEREKINSGLMDRYTKSQEAFPVMFEEFLANRGLSEDEGTAILDFAMNLAEKSATGELTEYDLDKIWRLMNLEKDEAAFSEDREIADLNAEVPPVEDEDFAVPSGSSPSATPNLETKKGTPLDDLFKSGNMRNYIK